MKQTSSKHRANIELAHPANVSMTVLLGHWQSLW